MKTRLLFGVFLVLALSASLPAQATLKVQPLFKLGPLKAGDTLIIGISKQPILVTGRMMRLGVRVVVGEDGKLKPSFRVPLLDDVSAAGLTLMQLREALESRYAEANYEVNITVRVVK